MGAPKQKWTSEEEAALKAGIAKHGAGKWRTILKDPEFSSILCLRSNVDLKDKWRNMNVTANGFGSREKGRIALKKSRHLYKHDDNPMALSTVLADGDEEIVDAKPLAMSSGPLSSASPKRSVSRLDNLIFEAITTLKEPTGSNKTAIAAYIEDQYWPPPDFKRLLSAKLKALTSSGKLIKVKRKYRIAPSSSFQEGKASKVLLLEGLQREPSRPEKHDIKPFTKSQIDAELARMKSMTAQEAAAAAARAVAEAEAIMADAEEAAREAEAAEADAEAAKAFAEAAMLTLKNRNAADLQIAWRDLIRSPSVTYCFIRKKSSSLMAIIGMYSSKVKLSLSYF
ncbi:single myb histone 5 isoform X1 [Ananas comosus]|uniref:Single myb histone 5 isoform X1 n=1 Tax=Ananas comosus TaxID=4615 RepID=A0A6P5FIB8_ANACO|nr:single myb histone 5 isoform X1 [Ananas comosus]